MATSNLLQSSVDEEEMKYDSLSSAPKINLTDSSLSKSIVPQNDDNDNNVEIDKSYNKSRARIRSIPEIKSYLEHFIPELSFITTIQCFFLKPMSIFANIYFIVYQFYYTIFTDAIAHESVSQTEFIEICKKIVVLIEFLGLIFLFCCIIITKCKRRYAELIDCVRWCGSWSTFQLFYQFQPPSLISHLSIILKHHEKRLEDNTSKIERWENLKHDLKYEMEQQSQETNLFGIDNDKMAEAEKHLNFLIEIHESKDENDLIEKLKNPNPNHTQNALRHHTSMGSTVAAFIKWTPKDYHAFFEKMVHLSSWFVLILLLLLLLIIGLMSFLLKLSMFGFISTKPVNEWDLLSQTIPFLLFCNQIWNVINIDAIRVESVYRFLFVDSTVRNNRYVSQRMAMLDSIIKVGLWNGFGYRGFLIAVSLNAEIVQKIIVKKSTDLSTLKLIQYKATLVGRQNKNNNKSHYWLSMKKENPESVQQQTFNLDDSIDEHNNRIESIGDDTFISKNNNNNNNKKHSQNVKNIKKNLKNFDANWDRWDKWKNKMKQKCLQYADWLTLSHQRQSVHPYTSVRAEIDDYYNSLDSISDKILVTVRSRRINKKTVYNEYKLAVKSTKDETVDDDDKEDDNGSTITVYNPTEDTDWTMVRVTRSISKLIMKNQSESKRTGIEMDSFHSIDNTKKNARKYYKIYANTLIHKIVLFEWLERYVSFFAPYTMCIFALIALLATTISIYIYPDGITSEDHGCHDNEINVIKQMRNVNIAFMICCVIGVIYLGIFAYLTRIQARDEPKGITNCFKIGSHPQFLQISSILGLMMWLSLAILCWIRFIDFVRLKQKCKQHIIHHQTVLFVSIIGNGIFAIFMTIIAWITILSYVWLALIVFFMAAHLFLLYWFYVLGWNFTVHSITEFIMLFNEDIVEHHEFKDHCRTRFIFVAIIFAAFCIYFTIGILELYLRIKTDKNELQTFKKPKPKKKKVYDKPGPILLDESESISKQYTVPLKNNQPSHPLKYYNNKYRKKFIWTRRTRIVIVSIMYLCAMIHYIITHIIDEITGDITDGCQNSHYAILDSATYYNKTMENFFIFAMFLDLILFGKLFKSWKILLDPLFWLTRYIWYKTHKIIYSLLTLTITISILCVLSILFMTHDLNINV